jgi:TRAP-type C4-dicarboxylate transport system permease small subunit
MQGFHKFARVVAEIANHAIGWLLIITVALNVAQVFTRYVMNDPLFWTEEMIRYATVWLTFIGAAAASHYGDHMDMNLFGEVKSARFQAIHQGILHGIVLIFAVILIWQGARYTILNGMQTSPAMGMKMVWIYGSTALGGVMLFIVEFNKMLLSFFPEPGTESRPAEMSV